MPDPPRADANSQPCRMLIDIHDAMLDLKQIVHDAQAQLVRLELQVQFIERMTTEIEGRYDRATTAASAVG